MYLISASQCASASISENGEGYSCAADVMNCPSSLRPLRARCPPAWSHLASWKRARPGRFESTVVGLTEAAPKRH
eukprot:5086879-Alexandrium_andersonii.AAC.1